MSKNYQKTITNNVSINGVGLHTGLESKITFKPAQTNTGIRFVRTDVDNCPEIVAHIENVVDISRGTTIEKNGYKVHTVEHVIAATVGLKIDNILIELSSKEPPIMDGSAKPFVDALLKAKIIEQSELKDEIIIDKTISYLDSKRGVDIHVIPSDQFRITFMTDYNNDCIGTQFASLLSLENEFIENISSARTFCFFSEIIELKKLGLIKGGSIDNALVFIDKEIKDEDIIEIKKLFNITSNIKIGNNGILDGKELRYPNEPVRHKILDLIGDLGLLGKNIKGHIIATRSGHAANVELVKKINNKFSKNNINDNKEEKLQMKFDIHDIMKIMPHRYPFLLIDRILKLVPGKVVEAIKNVTITEPFYQGHFPNQPIMPGVLILESMAQAGAFLVLHSIKNPETKLMYFSAVKNARFKKSIIPGDQILYKVKLIKFKLGTCKIGGEAFVNNELVAKGELMATVVNRSN